MHGENELNALSEKLYEAYRRSCENHGWNLMRPNLTFRQQPLSVRAIWCDVAGASIELVAELKRETDAIIGPNP